MLDVHAPHERMQGFKDFLLHLFTITIGLLIALSLEGCVEWQHHRHIVHEAETGLHGEVIGNAQTLDNIRKEIHDEEKTLNQDLAVLAAMRAHPQSHHDTISFSYRIQSFDNVAWKTAQTTGAAAYMPYSDARDYSDIYGTQDEVFRVQGQTVDDVMAAASLMVAMPDNENPSAAKIEEITDRIGMIQMRLNLLNSLVDALDKTYKQYQTDHP